MINPTEIVRAVNPRHDDGVPLFETPWEARVFALTAYLASTQKVDWEDFKVELIAQIEKGDELGDVVDAKNGTPYYRAWLAATEALLAKADRCGAEDVKSRVDFLSQPHRPGKVSPTGSIPRPVAES